MPKTRLLIALLVMAVTLSCATPAAHAIIVQLGSIRNLPFSTRYPAEDRAHIRAALQNDGSKFIEGHSVNAISFVHFADNSQAVNEQLRALAECHSTTIAVSFQQIDRQCDWKVRYDARSMQFQFVINLNSKEIDLEELTIPVSKGPEPIVEVPAEPTAPEAAETTAR